MVTVSQYPRHESLWRQVEPHLAGVDLAHDRYHLERVYRWALRLAPEANADGDLAGACALVHDLVSVPKEHADRSLGGQRSADAAADLLDAAGYSSEEQREIRNAVACSSWSRGLSPNGPLAMVLQDADRLDAIGAIGIARTFACAQAMAGRSGRGRFYHPDDPEGSGRPLDDSLQALDHFSAKLLRLAEGMHLPSARAEAARRHQAMLTFIEELHLEIL